ncbi:TPA: type IV toxin-antitoxin system YeeU family antitoxin [Aeromonas bestiarum]|nr:type IV toxin-antitoxin system YeeU family antitoxin [Aeromonas bestiarum]
MDSKERHLLGAQLLTGELNAQWQQCITILHSGFTCEAETLGCRVYVYVVI